MIQNLFNPPDPDALAEARRHSGREAARTAGATERKPFGQTSPEVHPYTYWWIVGYNQFVDQVTN